MRKMSSHGGVGRRAVWSIGAVCVASAIALQCTPDETTSPVYPTEPTLETASSQESSSGTLRIVPSSLTIVAGDAHRVKPVTSVVGNTTTISISLIDKDSVVGPINPDWWSIDFDPKHLSISQDLLLRAFAPTPPGSTTPVVLNHITTGRTAQLDVTVLSDEPDSPNEPGGWPNNEPAGMTRILFVDGSTKDWPGFGQGRAWADDSRVSAVTDPRSKHGQAVEKRFFIGDQSGWRGITYNGNNTAFRELYFRIVFRLSSNWQWHRSGGKFFYYGSAGAPRRTATRQFILGWRADGRPFWSAAGDGRYMPNNVSAFTRGVYHTLEIHHVASTSGANGSLRMWVDGEEVRSFNRLGYPSQNAVQLNNHEWSATRAFQDKRLSRAIQAFMYWGGQNDTKRVNDWIRLSEMYISGRN